jgi:hypothetical protein
MSVAEEVSSEGQSTQAEGVATADSCIVSNTANATEVRCYHSQSLIMEAEGLQNIRNSFHIDVADLI